MKKLFVVFLLALVSLSYGATNTKTVKSKTTKTTKAKTSKGYKFFIGVDGALLGTHSTQVHENSASTTGAKKFSGNKVMTEFGAKGGYKITPKDRVYLAYRYQTPHKLMGKYSDTTAAYNINYTSISEIDSHKFILGYDRLINNRYISYAGIYGGIGKTLHSSLSVGTTSISLAAYGINSMVAVAYEKELSFTQYLIGINVGKIFKLNNRHHLEVGLRAEYDHAKPITITIPNVSGEHTFKPNNFNIGLTLSYNFNFNRLFN